MAAPPILWYVGIKVFHIVAASLNHLNNGMSSRFSLLNEGLFPPLVTQKVLPVLNQGHRGGQGPTLSAADWNPAHGLRKAADYVKGRIFAGLRPGTQGAADSQVPGRRPHGSAYRAFRLRVFVLLLHLRQKGAKQGKEVQNQYWETTRGRGAWGFGFELRGSAGEFHLFVRWHGAQRPQTQGNRTGQAPAGVSCAAANYRQHSQTTAQVVII